MRKTIIVGTVAALALTLAGVAVAHLKPSGSTAAAGEFSAARERADTRTCTGPDGRYEITRGRYAGTATSSDEALAGPIELQVKAVYNVDKKIGWLEGWLRIRKGDDDRRSKGRFWATLGDGGVVNGFVHGRVSHHYAALFSGLTATFSPAGGFASGKLGGSGGQTNVAVLVGRPCTGRSDSQPTAVKLSVKGEIAEITATSVSVKPNDGSQAQACARKDGRSPSLDGYAVGTKVEMGCALVDGTMTLLKIKKHR